MIVDGYSYTRKNDEIQVVNLNYSGVHAMVMTQEATILESSMDPIEQAIALRLWEKNKSFMEA